MYFHLVFQGFSFRAYISIGLGLSAHQVILVFVLDLGLFLIWSRKGHATKGHLIVYNLLYLPPIKGKTVLYLKIISHKGTIFQGLVIQIQDSFITYIVWSFVSDVQGAL